MPDYESAGFDPPVRVMLATVLAIALLGGCATSTYTPTNGQAFAAYDGEITVLREMPSAGYTQLGSGTAEGGLIHGEDALISSLKRQARLVGADTIVIIGAPQFHGDRVLAMQPIKTLSAIFLRAN